MALNLGVISSGTASQGKQKFFVSMDKRMATGDTIDSATSATSNPQVETSGTAKNDAVLSSNDGTVVAPIGRAVEFTVTSKKEVTATTNIDIDISYETTLGYKETVRVKLKIATVVE